jgi:hypothetical protein
MRTSNTAETSDGALVPTVSLHYYEGESVNRSQMDNVKQVIFEPGRKKTFIS